MLSISGIVLPVCFGILGFHFAEHGRAATKQEITVVLLCSVLFVVLELVALGFAIVGRRTVIGKVGAVISGILLVISVIVLSWIVAICFDRDDFWK
ncbi:hypothetical protein AYO40_00470 [Planctomycetaceae bacterium SCGC AG-212-D15]|nr:hypothetical protein AYO40_00470 [Planctomycetaceae bacterium SCGC AG-212-D15]